MGKSYNSNSTVRRRKVKKEFSPRNLTPRARTLRSTPQRVLLPDRVRSRKLTFKREGNGALLIIGVDGGYSSVYSKKKDKSAAIGDVIRRYGGPNSGISFQTSYTELFLEDLRN